MSPVLPLSSVIWGASLLPVDVGHLGAGTASGLGLLLPNVGHGRGRSAFGVKTSIEHSGSHCRSTLGLSPYSGQPATGYLLLVGYAKCRSIQTIQ